MTSADVLVVGGGIVGRSIALELARAGAGRVLVADRGDRQSGTRRSAAVIRSVTADPALCGLAAEGAEGFPAWTELTGGGCGFRAGGVVLVVPADEEPQLAATGRVRPLSAQEVRRRAPGYRVPRSGVAMLDRAGGVASPALALASLGAALRRAGAGLERLEVRRLLMTGDRVVGAVTDRGSVHCDAVVVAAGLWSVDVLRGTGVDLPIAVRKTSLVVLDRRLAGDPILDFVSGTLLRPYGRLRLLAGTRASADDAAGVLAPLRATAPDLAAARLRAAWNGFYDVTPDERPLIGPLPGLAGGFVAAGFSGGGFKLAPAVGSLAARMVLEGAAPPALSAFSPERFAPVPAS